jgi:predicted AAA+ superfamily ATPase
VIHFLPPWHENFQKRLVKSPKLYFYDVGLASHLLGITQASQWETHPLRGAFFETMVVSDMVKKGLSSSLRPEWYYWSSPSNVEVDLIELRGQEVHAYEIKSSATFCPEHLKNLRAWGELARLPNDRLHLVYAGDESLSHQGISISPWRQFTYS